MSQQGSEKIVLGELFLKRCTTADFKAADIEEALEKIIEPLVEAKVVKRANKTGLVKLLSERERQGSTGVGGGAAIPHTAFEGLDRVYGVLCRSMQGVNFNCVTGEKVHVFFLVLYPPEMQRERRLVLGRILELCRSSNFVKFLRSARGAKEMNETLDEVDSA